MTSALGLILGLLNEHRAGQHEVVRRQGCPACHAADPPPAEVVLGRLTWDPAAGPHGGLVYRSEPPDERDWIQVETASGGLVWRRSRPRADAIDAWAHGRGKHPDDL